jgi:hypothetical protein
MKRKTKPTIVHDLPQHMMLYVLLFTIFAIGFVVYTVWITYAGVGTTVSKATRPNFLTPGHDIFSLEADLSRLQPDPGEKEILELDALTK